MFWFPRFKCLEKETVSLFSAGGARYAAMCFVSSDLSVWRGKLCSFFLREGVGQTVFVFKI